MLKNKFLLLIGLTAIIYISVFFLPKYSQSPEEQFNSSPSNDKSITSSPTKNKAIVISGRTMGTSFSVKVSSPPSNITQSELNQTIEKLLLKSNQEFSHWKKDSELTQLNRSPIKTDIPLSSALYELLNLSQQISIETEGTFDISIAPSVNLWGFGPTEIRFEPPSDEKIKISQQKTDYTQLQLKPDSQSAFKKSPLQLDLSAIAKGYAVDRIAQYLENLKIKHYLVEIGGEIRTTGQKDQHTFWKIAVETPIVSAAQRQVYRVIQLPTEGYSIATSGNYRNFFNHQGKKYSHTLNPQTGKPITNQLASLSVLIPNAKNSTARADALATALTVMGKEKALQFAKANKLAVYLLSIENNQIHAYASPAFEKYFH